MTFTLEFTPEIEAAVLAQAQAKGLDASRYLQKLVSDQVVLTHTPRHSGSDAELPAAELRMENGVPVLHTGHVMGLSVINDTIDLVRQERDLQNFGK